MPAWLVNQYASEGFYTFQTQQLSQTERIRIERLPCISPRQSTKRIRKVLQPVQDTLRGRLCGNQAWSRVSLQQRTYGIITRPSSFPSFDRTLSPRTLRRRHPPPAHAPATAHAASTASPRRSPRKSNSCRPSWDMLFVECEFRSAHTIQ